MDPTTNGTQRNIEFATRMRGPVDADALLASVTTHDSLRTTLFEEGGQLCSACTTTRSC